ncbi:MAG TPA: phosphomannose isomerase type II C-terminal cupin domain [Candidatus Paceibacterota bacterium]
MSLLSHRDREDRPWGSFERFTLDEPCTVKLIRVNAEAELSLQRHAKRAEFWRVVEGSGKARVGEVERPLAPGDEVEVPRGEVHRLIGGPQGLLVLEIAKGDFDEGDIERLEDNFGRAAP